MARPSYHLSCASFRRVCRLCFTVLCKTSVSVILSWDITYCKLDSYSMALECNDTLTKVGQMFTFLSYFFFLISHSFGTSERLYFVILAFGYLHLYLSNFLLNVSTAIIFRNNYGRSTAIPLHQEMFHISIIFFQVSLFFQCLWKLWIVTVAYTR